MKCQHESENLTLHESKERAEPNEKKINIGGEEQRSLTVFIEAPSSFRKRDTSLMREKRCFRDQSNTLDVPMLSCTLTCNFFS